MGRAQFWPRVEKNWLHRSRWKVNHLKQMGIEEGWVKTGYRIRSIPPPPPLDCVLHFCSNQPAPSSLFAAHSPLCYVLDPSHGNPFNFTSSVSIFLIILWDQQVFLLVTSGFSCTSDRKHSSGSGTDSMLPSPRVFMWLSTITLKWKCYFSPSHHTHTA